MMPMPMMMPMTKMQAWDCCCMEERAKDAVARSEEEGSDTRPRTLRVDARRITT